MTATCLRRSIWSRISRSRGWLIAPRPSLRWLQLVESGLKARTGKALKPFIYANPSVINDELHNPPAFADYPLFLAHYAPTPAAPRPWSNDDILIWQYRENTSIPATVDDCDFCQFSTFQRGSRGRPVRAIQNRLIASGLLPAGSADGAFDSATHEAVKKFQDGHGLAVDGVVSPRTWVAMQWA